jgi:hypothetical protein
MAEGKKLQADSGEAPMKDESWSSLRVRPAIQSLNYGRKRMARLQIPAPMSWSSDALLTMDLERPSGKDLLRNAGYRVAKAVRPRQ